MDPTWRAFLRDIEQVRSVSPRVAATELRADGDDNPVLTGHFSMFNTWYEIDSFFEGRFLERVAPGAFKKTFSEANSAKDGHRIQILLEHGFDPQVGDKPLGTPTRLEEDKVGALYEARLFDAGYVRDLIPAFEAGVYGSSFRFRVLQEQWSDEPGRSDDNPDGIPERTITEVRVMEGGPTVFPASPTADAGMRSATDEFYERLRTRDPKHYDQLLARAREIRTPDKRAAAGTREDGAATTTEEPPEGHSEVAGRMQTLRRQRLSHRPWWEEKIA